MPEDQENNRPDRVPSNAQVDTYLMLQPMLESALGEMREFSKKKQDGIVNDTKVKLLNRLLRQLKDVLSKEPSSQYLDLLDETQLPQNGDVVLILGQFKAALQGFRSAHYVYRYGSQTWVTEEWIAEHEEPDDEESESEDDYEDSDSEDEDDASDGSEDDADDEDSPDESDEDSRA